MCLGKSNRNALEGPANLLFRTRTGIHVANKLNDSLILVRFAVGGKDLWFDYNLLYEGGLSTFTILNTYKQFASICEEVIAENRELFGKC